MTDKHETPEQSDINTAPPLERMYTYRQAAEITGLTYATVRFYAIDYPRYRRYGSNKRYIAESTLRDMMSRRYKPVAHVIANAKEST